MSSALGMNLMPTPTSAFQHASAAQVLQSKTNNEATEETTTVATANVKAANAADTTENGQEKGKRSSHIIVSNFSYKSVKNSENMGGSQIPFKLRKVLKIVN